MLTKALLDKFEKAGRQPDVPLKEKIVIAKFFNPVGAGTWYATEYDPEERTFFGYVSLFGDHNDAWGYFSLDELESYRGPFGLGIERDLNWPERPAGEIVTHA